MAEEKSVIELLLELGVIKETDEPVNVMLDPQTDLNAPIPTSAADDLEAFYHKSAHDPFWGTRFRRMPDLSSRCVGCLKRSVVFQMNPPLTSSTK